MHRFNCHFQFDGGDVELSTVVTANDQATAERMAREKLMEKGWNVDGVPCITDFLE